MRIIDSGDVTSTAPSVRFPVHVLVSLSCIFRYARQDVGCCQALFFDV